MYELARSCLGWVNMALCFLAFMLASVFYDTFYNEALALGAVAQHISPVVLEVIFYLVLIGGVGVSVFLTLMHTLGGGLFGATSGGVLAGLKHGRILGLIDGAGRLWPYGFVVGLAAFFFNGPWWHWAVAFLVGVLLLTVQSLANYVWARVDHTPPQA